MKSAQKKQLKSVKVVFGDEPTLAQPGRHPADTGYPLIP
jgi:hypothetical protein